jgi:antitoxin ParD1/3/4
MQRSAIRRFIGAAEASPRRSAGKTANQEKSCHGIPLNICFTDVLCIFMRFAMHINLSKEMEQYLQSKVGAGFYSNAAEVVRDAIRRMREEDEKLAALRAAVQVGDAQLDRGEGVPYTPERLATITEKAFANARQGKKINPDVAP